MSENDVCGLVRAGRGARAAVPRVAVAVAVPRPRRERHEAVVWSALAVGVFGCDRLHALRVGFMHCGLLVMSARGGLMDGEKSACYRGMPARQNQKNLKFRTKNLKLGTLKCTRE